MATDSVALIFVDTEITAPPAKHGRQGKARSNIGMLFWIRELGVFSWGGIMPKKIGVLHFGGR